MCLFSIHWKLYLLVITLKIVLYNFVIFQPIPSFVSFLYIYYFMCFQEDGSSVSIFSLSGSSSQDGHLAAGRNGVKRLRTVNYSTFTCRFQSPTHLALDRMMPLQCLLLLFSTRRG